MKCAIYNPYWDTLGGGERYTIGFARALTEKGYRVDIQWNDKQIISKIENRFGIQLPDINVVNDVAKGDGYDVCFWVSDGSIPLLRARNNILHFQVPFSEVEGKTLLNKMKLFRINTIVCNSLFTKNIIDRKFGVNSKVIYPPVDVSDISPKNKKNIILSVGRFSQLKQAKRQDVLIEAFKKLTKNKYKKWKLVLAGGSEIGADDFIKKLKKQVQNLNISIIENPDFKEIVNLYASSKIFWTASGYGIDDQKNPELVEHFGITIVEAMSAGCIVFAHDAGGHRETVIDGENGYLWLDTRQLINKTEKCIRGKIMNEDIIRQAISSAQKYSYEKFKEEVFKII